MTAPSLTDLFGANATQTSAALTIYKSDLAAVGLTASATNSAESLFVALLLLAATKINSTTQASNSDITVTIDNSNFPQIINRNSQSYRQVTYNVNLQKIDTGSTIDPDDY